MARRQSEFRKLLVDISERLTEDDVANCAFLCDECDTSSASNMLEKIWRRGIFSPSNIDPLVQLLQNIDRDDLVAVLVDVYVSGRVGLEAEAKEGAFKNLLLKISLNMSPRDTISLAIVNKVNPPPESALELLQVLYVQGIISGSSCGALDQMLQTINRHDLANLVKKYANKFPEHGTGLPQQLKLFPPSYMDVTDQVYTSSESLSISHSSESQPVTYNVSQTVPLPPYTVPPMPQRLAERSNTVSSSYNVPPVFQPYGYCSIDSGIGHSTDISTQSSSSQFYDSHYSASSRNFDAEVHKTPSALEVTRQSTYGRSLHVPYLNSSQLPLLSLHRPAHNNMTVEDRFYSPSIVYEEEEEYEEMEPVTSLVPSPLTHPLSFMDNLDQHQSLKRTEDVNWGIKTVVESSEVDGREALASSTDTIETGNEGGKRKISKLIKIRRGSLMAIRKQGKDNSGNIFMWRIPRIKLERSIWSHDPYCCITCSQKLELNTNLGRKNPKLQFELYPYGLCEDLGDSMTMIVRLHTSEKSPPLSITSTVSISLTVFCDCEGGRHTLNNFTIEQPLHNLRYHTISQVATHAELQQTRSKYVNFSFQVKSMAPSPSFSAIPLSLATPAVQTSSETLHSGSLTQMSLTPSRIATSSHTAKDANRCARDERISVISSMDSSFETTQPQVQLSISDVCIVPPKGSFTMAGLGHLSKSADNLGGNSTARPTQIQRSESTPIFSCSEKKHAMEAPVTPVNKSDICSPDYITPITSLTCTSNGLRFVDEANDFILQIPKGAIPQSDTLTIDVGVALFGPFQFPKGLRPVSPVFWVCVRNQPNFIFSKSVSLTIPHFLNLESGREIRSLCLTFLKIGHEQNPSQYHEFHATDGEAHFDLSMNTGHFRTKHFCSFCIACKDTPTCLSMAKFCLTIFLPHRAIIGRKQLGFFFITLYNLKTCLAKVDEVIQRKKLEHYEKTQVEFDFKSWFYKDAALEINITQPAKGKIGFMGKKKIFRSEVDFFLKRRTAAGDMKGLEEKDFYPPRFQIFLVSVADDVSLSEGKIKFKGARSELEYDVFLEQPEPDVSFHSLTLSSTQSTEIGSSDASMKRLDISRDVPCVRTHLKDLEERELRDLFQELGLEYSTVNNPTGSRQDVAEKLIREWILEKDDVLQQQEYTGATWDDLRKALKKLKHHGIAQTIPV